MVSNEAISHLPPARSLTASNARRLDTYSQADPVGDKLLGNLLSAGWIERSEAGDLYRITETGRTAFRTPVPLR